MGRKWNNIKEKKAQKDKNTSRIYAKFGKEIYVAAKSGEPNPESNQTLRLVLERAKTYSVPNHIIDRAIDKAKGAGWESVVPCGLCYCGEVQDYFLVHETAPFVGRGKCGNW